MDGAPDAGQPSSARRVRQTKLLDLPDELLSRVLDFLIPKPAVYPTAASVTGHESNIGLTCTRLFTLVKNLLRVQDFVQSVSLFMGSSNNRKLCRNIESVTRVASHYIEVLRLPDDFWPKDPGLTTLGECPHLRELSFPVKNDLDQRGAENFFANHKNLEVLKITEPSEEVLRALRNTSLKLRKLDLIQLCATDRVLSLVEELLAGTPELESLTISFSRVHLGNALYGINLERDPQDVLKSEDAVLPAFKTLLHRIHEKIPRLRELSVDMTFSYRHRQDPEGVRKMAQQVARFGSHIQNARTEASIKSPVHQLTELHLRMCNRGELQLAEFMKGLVGNSTNVTTEFRYLTVSYPGNVDGTFPRPTVRKLNFVFEDAYGTLLQSAEMKLQSIRVHTMAFTKHLDNESSRVVLSDVFRENNLESICIDYQLLSEEDVRATVKFLHFVTTFAPTVRFITIPASTVLRSDVLSSTDLKQMRCAENVSVLSLHYKDNLFVQGRACPVSWGGAQSFAAKLPLFLDNIRQGFPNLTRLYLERTRIRWTIAQDTFRRAESVIRKYESETGVDASSFRAQLFVWVGADP